LTQLEPVTTLEHQTENQLMEIVLFVLWRSNPILKLLSGVKLLVAITSTLHVLNSGPNLLQEEKLDAFIGEYSS
jgi:hypothetical protein